MEQDRAVRDVAAAGVWAEVWVKAGVEWAGHLPPGRAGTVCVRTVEKRLRTSPEHRVTSRVVPSAAQ